MKKIKLIVLVILVALLFSTSSVYAVGNVNGNDWNDFSNNEKEVYLEGLFDGLNFLLAGISVGMEPDREITEIVLELEKEGELFLLQEDDYSKMIDTLNEIYSDDNNLNESIMVLFLEERVAEDDIGI